MTIRSEIALAADVATRERAEQNRAPDAKLRQRPHDSLELGFQPAPTARAVPQSTTSRI